MEGGGKKREHDGLETQGAAGEVGRAECAGVEKKSLKEQYAKSRSSDARKKTDFTMYRTRGVMASRVDSDVTAPSGWVVFSWFFFFQLLTT